MPTVSRARRVQFCFAMTPDERQGLARLAQRWAMDQSAALRLLIQACQPPSAPSVALAAVADDGPMA